MASQERDLRREVIPGMLGPMSELALPTDVATLVSVAERAEAFIPGENTLWNMIYDRIRPLRHAFADTDIFSAVTNLTHFGLLERRDHRYRITDFGKGLIQAGEAFRAVIDGVSYVPDDPGNGQGLLDRQVVAAASTMSDLFRANVLMDMSHSSSGRMRPGRLARYQHHLGGTDMRQEVSRLRNDQVVTGESPIVITDKGRSYAAALGEFQAVLAPSRNAYYGIGKKPAQVA